MAAAALLALPVSPAARADVVPGTCVAVPPLSGCPAATITSSPPASTTATTAAFGFTWSSDALVPDTSATFQCRLAGPGQTGTFADCATQPASGQTTGGQDYAGLTPGDYTFTVHASGAFGPGPDASYAWTVTPLASAPTDAPQTSFRDRPGTYLRDDFFELRFAADQPVAGYRCTLDGAARACAGGSYLLRGIGSGTHRFSVAAVGTTGQVDPTPAVARFTLPVDSTRLAHYSRGWRKRQAAGCFLDTYSLTRRSGAWVSQGTRGATRVDLVVTEGPGYGAVKVFLGNRLLKTVSLAADTRRPLRFVKVAAWRTARRGVIRVVSTSRRPVRVEGLGIVGRPKG